MVDRPADDKFESSNPTPTKKAYKAPALIEWGTLRDITQSVGNSGASDGSKGKANNRTH